MRMIWKQHKASQHASRQPDLQQHLPAGLLLAAPMCWSSQLQQAVTR